MREQEPNFRYQHKWRRWIGPVHHLREAADIALQELTEQEGESVHTRVEMQVEQLTAESSNLDELGGLSDRDVRGIRSLRINLGKGAVAILATADSKNPALELIVEGTSRTRVEGMSSRLVNRLSAGQAWLSKTATDTLAVTGALVIGGLVWSVGLLLANRLSVDLGDFGEQGDLTPAGTLLVVSSVVIPIVSAFVLRWLFAPLQFILPGGKSRVRRFGVRLTAALTLLTTLIPVVAWLLER